MNLQFSIIIICKNEADHIEQAINSVCSLSNDIVVYDSGSTDGTLKILENLPVKLYQGAWEGFGKTRQKAVDLAIHDWVLIIDADEVVTPELAEELKSLNQPDEHTAYRILLRNHLQGHHVKWGVWGHDYRIRLYARRFLQWNEQTVHEKLMIPEGTKLVDLKNSILHYTAETVSELANKMDHYALLTAAEYFRQGKKAGTLKVMTAPIFAFVKSYFIKLGFLDGSRGFTVAGKLAHYTFLKYRKLYQLAHS